MGYQAEGIAALNQEKDHRPLAASAQLLQFGLQGLQASWADGAAGDLPKLAALHAELREQVSASPLFDARRFARNFEDAMWGMWQARMRKSSRK